MSFRVSAAMIVIAALFGCEAQPSTGQEQPGVNPSCDQKQSKRMPTLQHPPTLKIAKYQRGDQLSISVEAASGPEHPYAELTRGDDRVCVPLIFEAPVSPEKAGIAHGKLMEGMDLGRWNVRLMWGTDPYGAGVLEIQPPETGSLKLTELDPETTYDLTTAYVPDPQETAPATAVNVSNERLNLPLEQLPNLRINWRDKVYGVLWSDCETVPSLGDQQHPVPSPARFFACKTDTADVIEIRGVPDGATFFKVDDGTQPTPISSTTLNHQMYFADASKISASMKKHTVSVTLHGGGFQVVNPSDNAIWINGVRQTAVWDSCSLTLNLGANNKPQPLTIHGELISAEEIRLCSVPVPANGSLQLAVGYGDTQSQPKVLRAFNLGKTPVATTSGLIALVLALLPLLLLSCLRRSYRIGDSDYKWRMLFLDPETDTYSLSKLQFYLWTVAAIFSYAYLFISRVLVQFASWPDVPGSLPGIILVAGGTAVTSQVITATKGSKGAGEEKPGWADFITSGGVVAADRLQMLLWTLFGVGAFLYAVWQLQPGTITDLPAIPDRLMVLMGISSAGYLGGKIARKAGPVIAEMSIMPAESDAALALERDAGESPDLVGAITRAQQTLTDMKPITTANAKSARDALDQAVRNAGAAHTSAEFAQLVTDLGARCTNAETAAATAATDFAGDKATSDEAEAAQSAAAALQEFTADVLQAISLASDGPMQAEEAPPLIARTIELRGTNLSPDALFEIDQADLPFRMMIDKDGKNQPEIVTRDSVNPTFASLLRITIDPMKLGDSDQTQFAAWFGNDGHHTLTIINPDGQKSELSFDVPPATAQKVKS